MKKDWSQQFGGVILGASLMIVISSPIWFQPNIPISPNPSDNTVTHAPTTFQELPFHSSDSCNLMQTAFSVVNSLENSDYTQLSSYIHPKKGVRFTPFSTVNIETDVVLKAEQIEKAESDLSTYQWGVQTISGEPITLTIADYFSRFVTPLSYSKAPHIASDTVLISGNALENVGEFYTEGRFVDFSFRSIDPDMNGADWSSLKLVFEEYESTWVLVGIIHGEWTA